MTSLKEGEGVFRASWISQSNSLISLLESYFKDLSAGHKLGVSEKMVSLNE